MKGRTIIAAALLCLAAAPLRAAVPIMDTPGKTLIAPKYFGPYAFPVPDVSDGTVHGSLYAELSCDGVAGRLSSEPDYTLCPTFRLAVPLWTDRVNLLIYGDIHEFYRDPASVRALRRVSPNEPLEDDAAGNLYYGLDMLVLREGKYVPSFVMSAVTQSATGDKYEQARHYDSPGYYFSLAAGKTFGAFHVSAYGGFLCWQTAMGRQNDAYMLGLKASCTFDCFRASAEYGTYTGWEEDGDCPRALKLRAEWRIGRFSPFVYYSHGFNDWPFDLLRFGVAFSLH